MQRITLNTTSLESSVLGFGCVSLTLHDNPAKAVALLNEAFDLGVTHYDVARLYGFGQAESILGQFLQGKRDRVTVATKFGLQANENLAKHRRLVSFARKMVHKFPALRKLIVRGAPQPLQASRFDPQSAAASLEKSLTELKTDFVDLFMLHEAGLEDVRRGDVQEFLEAQVKRGTIRFHGVASGFAHLPADLAAFPGGCRVVQTEHNAVKQNLSRLAGTEQRGMITFSVLSAAKPLLAAASADPQRARRFSDQIGLNIADSHALTHLLLHYAISSNPNGITLFGTKSIEHLREDVALLEKKLTAEQLALFSEYARQVAQTEVPRQ